MPSLIDLHPQRTSFPNLAVAARACQASCQSCRLRQHCLPGGVRIEELEAVQNVVYVRRRVRRGETLFRSGDHFSAVYAIRAGFFKTSVVRPGGQEHVTAFPMDGELLGIDGIGEGRHNGNAVALEDSEVCVMPYSLIESIGRDYPALHRRLSSLLARQIRRDHEMMVLLGWMHAKERLAAFLCELSSGFAGRGRSPSDIRLRMKRAEIGSYLGLKLESVSRAFSQLERYGLISVCGKRVRILDIAGLASIIGAAG